MGWKQLLVSHFKPQSFSIPFCVKPGAVALCLLLKIRYIVQNNNLLSQLTGGVMTNLPITMVLSTTDND